MLVHLKTDDKDKFKTLECYFAILRDKSFLLN